MYRGSASIHFYITYCGIIGYGKRHFLMPNAKKLILACLVLYLVVEGGIYPSGLYKG